MNSLVLTVEEGNALLNFSANFRLEEKLGDHAHTIVDQATAADEVRQLYKELRRKSPLLQTPERYHRFGPAKAWQEYINEKGNVAHKFVEPLLEVTISLDEDTLSGVVWCLIAAMHPGSALIQPPSLHEDLIYPIAIKIKRLRVIREYIGLIDGKPRGKRWQSDDEPAKPVDEAKK